MESLDSELGLDSVIDRAATGGTKNPDAAIASLSAGAAGPAPKVDFESPSSESSAKPRASKRKTRAEQEAEIEELRAANAAMSDKLNAATGVGNEQAVKDLGAVIAFAVRIAGRWNAARTNAPHWVFAEDEAQNIGDAWAVVVAPYAEQLKELIPLGLALHVTWNALEPRLEKDKILAADSAEVTDVRTTGNGE